MQKPFDFFPKNGVRPVVLCDRQQAYGVDVALRQRVVPLLRSLQQACGFLNKVVAPAAISDVAPRQWLHAEELLIPAGMMHSGWNVGKTAATWPYGYGHV
jgi:hypothetical protein